MSEYRLVRLPDRLGFRGKTLWDWLQLLIVPTILVGVTFTWSAAQTRSDNKRQDEQIEADREAAEEVRQDTTLTGYLQQMSDLVLHENLLASESGGAVRSVAGTLTLTTLRRLDGKRKGEVVRFLADAYLIRGPDPTITEEPHVYLIEADLTAADLKDAALGHTVLAEANLTRANLAGAELGLSDLSDANFTRANLAGAQLSEAYLAGATSRGRTSEAPT